MKRLLPFVIIFVSFSLSGEIVTNTKYNYSVFPLEGWVMQDYSDPSSLSWISADNGVYFSVDSWDGDTFSDIDVMFNELSENSGAKGSCVKFKYLGRDSAVGDVTVESNGVTYRGWILFIDGYGNDYYITAFSLLENYDLLFAEIQSAIDSFAIGKEGALAPGPLTTFLEETPNRGFVRHEVDFFGNILNFDIKENELIAAQTLIEREATIMKKYSNDPDNFYNAWKRYYKLIFRDNYSRLDGLFNSLYPYLGSDKYTPYKLSELLMFWIQSYNYQRNLNSASDLLNPLEASISKTGDCDARSLVLAILLHKFKINSILMTSEKVKHAMLAVDCDGEGARMEFDGTKYLVVELTAKVLMGEIKSTMSDPKIWTIIDMEYDSGF